MSNEALYYMTDWKGKRVLELGSACSKYSESLAKTASHVTLVCFREEEEKREGEKNNALRNFTLVRAALPELTFPKGSFDMVISDTLFKDTDDHEVVSETLRRILKWLTPGGLYLLLESTASLNPIPCKRSDVFVPRTHTQYCHLILQAMTDDAAFRVIRGKNMLTNKDESGRRNIVSYVAQRVERAGDSREALMNIRYSQAFIFKLEWIFGHTWVSTGGETTTRDFCGRLGLRHNYRVLDAGCGTGGSAFFMARHYGVYVHGVDISTNMINIAIERLGHCETKLRDKLQFEIQDIVEANYRNSSFDVIYSRDVILHINEKAKLFNKFYHWLKPGGTLFITDYCKGTGEATQDYLEYESKSYSTFVTVESYGSSLKEVGFKDVRAEDLSDRFYDIQKEEQNAFLPTKEAFVREYSQKEFKDLAKICADKLVWVKKDQFAWGAFTATR